MTKKLFLISVAAVSAVAYTAQAREQLHIVGSSTVFPFATAVAEEFGKSSGFKTPVVESTGTGGGIKLFCSGKGANHPDIVNASRRIKTSEIEACAAAGINQITEVKIGYDGIVMANSTAGAQINFTLKDIYLALAKEIPTAEGKTVPNPYTTWMQVNPSLPDVKIEVLGPPPTSGTRDAFAELAMEGGCKSFPWVKALSENYKESFHKICHTVREDGAYVEAGENDNLIVQKLKANPNAFGVFGYSFLEQNADSVQGSKIEGVTPDFDAIATGAYTVSRPLYFYVKNGNVDAVPGLKEFVNEFSSEKAWGPEGYLSEKGLIPLPDDERSKSRSGAQSLTALTM